MKFRIAVILGFSLFAGAVAHGQSDNTIHVKAFPGGTVGAKVTNAMSTCPTGSPCILVIDASLVSSSAGTIPPLCSGCVLVDYRNGAPRYSAIDLEGPVVNPMLPPYNAKCDGTTDDSTALQHAIDAAQKGASSGTLFIPEGKSCKFGTTLAVTGYLTIEGTEPKANTGTAGSGLIYTGSGDGIVVGTSGRYSYFFSFKNLNYAAGGPAKSLIHLYGINGPSLITNDNFEGNWGAASAIIYDVGSGLQTILANNFFAGFLSNEVVGHAVTNMLIEANQFFATYGTGLYLSTPEDVEVKNNYFELMLYGIEVVNDDESHMKLSIHDNRIRNAQQPGTPPNYTTDPVESASARCILFKSTTKGLPFYGEASVRDNSCFLSYISNNTMVQGPEPYGIDWETSSNRFYVNFFAEVENNAVAGVTTAGVHSDNSAVTISYRDIKAVANWTPGSFAPSPIPAVSGSGTFSNPVITAAAVSQQTYSGTSGTGYLTLLAAGANLGGVYRICEDWIVTVAGTAGTFQGWVDYVSNGHTAGISAMATPTVSVTSQWRPTSAPNCLTFHSDASHPISYSIVGSSITGTPTIVYDMTLEKLN